MHQVRGSRSWLADILSERQRRSLTKPDVEGRLVAKSRQASPSDGQYPKRAIHCEQSWEDTQLTNSQPLRAIVARSSQLSKLQLVWHKSSRHLTISDSRENLLFLPKPFALAIQISVPPQIDPGSTACHAICRMEDTVPLALLRDLWLPLPLAAGLPGLGPG